MSDMTANDKLTSDVAMLKADLGRVRTDLTSIASTLLERGKDTLGATKDKAGEHMDASIKAARNVVGQRPLTSAMVALSVGVVVGMLIGRR